MIHQFTLILKNVHTQTPNLEDSLFEAGCDDALINSRNGTVYLDFDREAPTLEEAVIRAISDVERSTVKAIVASVAPEDWVSESDIASRLDTNRQSVSLWIKGNRRTTHTFPLPVMKLTSRSPLWKWCEVAEWLLKNEIITDRQIVADALFIENINAVLEERYSPINQERQRILKLVQKRSA